MGTTAELWGRRTEKKALISFITREREASFPGSSELLNCVAHDYTVTPDGTTTSFVP